MIERQRPDRLSRLLATAALLVAAAPIFPSSHDCPARSLKEASRAVREAEAAVTRAAEAGALWLNAQEALERAKAALTRGDPAQAACAAAAARSFAALGLQQLQYAPYRTNSGDQP